MLLGNMLLALAWAALEGDFSLPNNAGEPANDHVKALGPVLDKLKLDYTRYINVHASAAPQTKADVDAALAARRAADAKAGTK